MQLLESQIVASGARHFSHYAPADARPAMSDGGLDSQHPPPVSGELARIANEEQPTGQRFVGSREQ
jgi:hypothetical protein